MSLRGLLDPLPKPWCNIVPNSIVGNTGGNAPVGAVGEYLSGYTTDSLPSSGPYFNFLTLALTAGDYDCTLTSNWAIDNQTLMLAVGISTDNGSTFNDLVEGSNNARIAYNNPAPNNATVFMTVPNVRVSTTTPVTLVAKVTSTYSGASPTGALRLSARRVR
jgi:hypothetical protein